MKAREPQRTALYKATVALVRAYANIADELDAAGYSEADIRFIKQKLDEYLKLRDIIRKASGESLNLKAYKADMRHLIDTYIEADEPRKISPFENMSLLELIVKTGIANAINSQLGGLKGNKEAVAETIENNVRSKISTPLDAQLLWLPDYGMLPPACSPNESLPSLWRGADKQRRPQFIPHTVRTSRRYRRNNPSPT